MVVAMDYNLHKHQTDNESVSQADSTALSLLLGDGKGWKVHTREMHFGYFTDKGDGIPLIPLTNIF